MLLLAPGPCRARCGAAARSAQPACALLLLCAEPPPSSPPPPRLQFWEPLGKLTFGAYLIHPIILRVYFYALPNLWEISPTNMAVVRWPSSPLRHAGWRGRRSVLCACAGTGIFASSPHKANPARALAHAFAGERSSLVCSQCLTVCPHTCSTGLGLRCSSRLVLRCSPRPVLGCVEGLPWYAHNALRYVRQPSLCRLLRYGISLPQRRMAKPLPMTTNPAALPRDFWENQIDISAIIGTLAMALPIPVSR